MNAFWGFLISSKLCFDGMLEVFNWIEVWGLGRPLYDIETMVFEPGLGHFAGVLGVIVLLENHITR